MCTSFVDFGREVSSDTPSCVLQAPDFVFSESMIFGGIACLPPNDYLNNLANEFILQVSVPLGQSVAIEAELLARVNDEIVTFKSKSICGDQSSTSTTTPAATIQPENLGWIAGPVIGGLIVILLVCVLMFFKRKQTLQPAKDLPPVEMARSDFD